MLFCSVVATAELNEFSRVDSKETFSNLASGLRIKCFHSLQNAAIHFEDFM